MSKIIRLIAVSTLMLCAGCVYQPVDYDRFDTSPPDVPSIQDTYQPKHDDDSEATASLAAKINALDSDLAEGMQSRDRWIAKQGLRDQWSDEQKDFLTKGDEIGDELRASRKAMVDEYNARALKAGLPPHVE
jgi:hypothetical protein